MCYRKHHIIASLLLILISSPILLFVYFSTEQQFIRIQMKEALEHRQLQTITIVTNTVKWFKKDKEIIIGGRLFDIKSHEEKDGISIFTGLFDEKETAIKKKMEKLRHEQNDSTNTIVSQILSSVWCQPEDISSINDIRKPVHINAYVSYFKSDLLNSFLSAPSPPPK